MNKKILLTASLLSISALAVPSISAQASGGCYNYQNSGKNITVISNLPTQDLSDSDSLSALLKSLQSCQQQSPSYYFSCPENQGDTSWQRPCPPAGDTAKPETPNAENNNNQTEKPNTGNDCGQTDKPNTGNDCGQTDKPSTGNGSGQTDKPSTGNSSGQTDKPSTGSGSGSDTSDSVEYSKLSYSEKVVYLVNEHRADNGLSPLTVDKNLQAAALVRAKEIQTSFSHTRPDGRSFSTVLKEKNVSYKGAGENIAWGQKTPEQVVEAWMNSAGHRANILNARYTSIGIGYLQNSKGTNYWVQLFTY